MSLLSPAEILEIRAAVKSVTDTFMVTPIEYYKHVAMSDNNMEDNQTEKWQKFNFFILAEYNKGTQANEVKKMNAGSFDFGDVTITANIIDLQDIGFIDAEFMPKAIPETDYFKVQGKIYKVLDCALDGPLEKKQVLVMFSGELDTKVKQFTNLVT